MRAQTAGPIQLDCKMSREQQHAISIVLNFAAVGCCLRLGYSGMELVAQATVV